MLLLEHLFFLLAPAAVLGAPHTESNDGNSQLSGRADNAADKPNRTPFYVDPRHIIELRHHEMTDTVLEIPPDQMSGTVRIHYDPDLEPIHEANDKSPELGTSPVPVSDLVRRNDLTEGACRGFVDPRQPHHVQWYLKYAACTPPDPRAYQVFCEDGTMTSPGIEKQCPEHTICWDEPKLPGKGHSDILCKSEQEATKKTSSPIRGIVKTITKLFARPPRGMTRLLHLVFTFARDGKEFQVNNIKGISDGSLFKEVANTNGVITEIQALANGESVYWQADAGQAFFTLEWSWKWVA